jgi:hypothetical protein
MALKATKVIIQTYKGSVIKIESDGELDFIVADMDSDHKVGEIHASGEARIPGNNLFSSKWNLLRDKIENP